MRRQGKRALWVFLALLVLSGGYLARDMIRRGGPAVSYRTASVTRGDLLATIGATGSLEPEEAIDVGAQVAGQISRFGTQNGKPIDRRSFVKSGELLAQIDPSLYRMDLASAQAQLAQSGALLAQNNAQLTQSEAQIAQGEASVVKAQADIEQMEGKRAQAEEDWNRAQRLRKEGPDTIADSAYGGYKAAYLVAVANVAGAKAVKAQAQAARAQASAAREQALAAIEQAKAAIKGNQAAVDRAQRNLDYCTITSPVDGVVIDRRVNIGQTVVASLNAPSLFLIAKDLSRMQIWVSVNEADIGSVHDDQPVSFTVDARPGVTFSGRVTKVRFDATMTQNVVTYPVEVLALNPDGLLYPYMTANVQFELDRRKDALRVPNAALRYAPLSTDQVAPEFRSELEGLARQSASPGAPAPATAGDKSSAAAPREAARLRDQGIVWAPQGEFLRPISVRVGMSDGTMSEVQGPDLKEGLAVVVSEDWRAGAPQGGAPSPFVPQMRRR